MLKKVKAFMADKWNKLAGAVAGVGTFVTGAITARAEGPTQAVSAATEAVSAAKSVMETATATLNIGNIVAIIGAGIGAVIGLFLAWWGARKLVRMLKNAFTKGNVTM